MFEKEENVIISGQAYSHEIFMFLLTCFKEAFSHSSLTIENAFKELDYYESLICKTMDRNSLVMFESLPPQKKDEVFDVIQQILVFKASQYGVFPDRITGDAEQIKALYDKYLTYFEPYVGYYLVFDVNGKFDKKATFHRLDALFSILPHRKNAYDRAYNMNKDHMDAFDYAMSKKSLTLGDAIKINEIVNNSDVDKEPGFKKVNNTVIGASFDTADKKDVPGKMQELFYDYNNNFGMTIKDPNEFGLETVEKNKRLLDIFRKEAIFHIRFIQIHPFKDGNGRTGRIIINQHLLSQGIAPIIISDAMSDEYCKCINENDVEKLALLLFYSSSLQSNYWYSINKFPAFDVATTNVDNSQMAIITDFDDGVVGYQLVKKDKLL